MADPTPASGPFAVLAQLKQLWDKQSKGRRTLAIAVLLGLVAVLAITTVAGRSDSWATISEGASPDDAQELYAALQTRGISARIKDGKVEVPKGSVEEARAVAAASGLPRSGKGFELFDGTNLGQSSFAEQVNYRRALQGELSRSITAMAQVQGARVHIALGRRSVFKDQSDRPTASVALHLHPGQTLTGEQVRGVRQLVAASIEGLEADAVVVIDHHGNLLDGASPGSGDQKANIERSVAARVRTMLERVVGEGKVSVVATASVDERKVSETQELFDNTNPAVRSESRTVDGVDPTGGAGAGSGGGVGGVAGVRGNLPGAPAAAPTGGTGTGSGGRLQETKNYEISRTVRQTTKPDVLLQKLQLAVVVDYKLDADGKPIPRTDKELAELTALARQAAGIDDARGDKIEVASIPFAPDLESAAGDLPPAGAAGLPMMYVAIGGGALLFLLLLTVIIMKKRAKKKAANRPLSLALPAPVSELERVLEARPSNDLGSSVADAAAASAAAGLPAGKPVRERVLEHVRSDVERAAEVLTGWLAEVPPPAPATKGAKS